MKKIVATLAVALVVGGAQAGLVDLNFVNVSAPPINCVFDTSCVNVVSDTTSPIAFPGWGPGTPFFLQSRTFTGNAGAPAAGLYGYEYRVNLDIPPGVTGPGDECLFAVTLDFGPIVPMDFDGSGTLSSAYIVTGGAVGTIAPTVVQQDGSSVNFIFALEGDTGLISQMCPGGSSFFIGLVSTQPPVASVAAIDNPVPAGSAQFGVPAESVKARTPKINPFSVILNIINVAADFPLLVWTGSDEQTQRIHRRVTLDLLQDARDLVGSGETGTADSLLQIVLGKVHGQQGSWLENNPSTGVNAQTLLYEKVATAINLLQPDSPVPMLPAVQSGPPGT